MSGTDHNAQPEWEGPSPVMMLIRPQMGENIGAAARAMWNFGLPTLRLVAPRDGWPNPKATAMASGAAPVLDRLGLFPSTREAAADLSFIYATTARRRDLNLPVLTPEDAMRDAQARLNAGQKIGVMFGPERAGLENDDLTHANAIISVPVNPGFASLNLAQCVLLIAYEWRRLRAESVAPHDTPAPATAAERQALIDRLEARLEQAHFFWPGDKAPMMRQNLRSLFSRLPLSSGDVRILHGVFRALADRHPTK